MCLEGATGCIRVLCGVRECNYQINKSVLLNQKQSKHKSTDTDKFSDNNKTKSQKYYQLNKSQESLIALIATLANNIFNIKNNSGNTSTPFVKLIILLISQINSFLFLFNHMKTFFKFRLFWLSPQRRVTYLYKTMRFLNYVSQDSFMICRITFGFRVS